MHNLADIVDAGVPSTGPAIVFTEDGRRASSVLSYGQVRERIQRIACGLSEFGLVSGDRVAILAENRPEHFLSFLGMARAGLVAVPVNQKLRRDGVRAIVDDTGVRLTLCDARNEGLLAKGHPRIDLDGQAFAALCNASSTGLPETTSTTLAVIMHTSGSTGRPKPVPITHAGYGWAIRSFDFLRSSIEGKAVLLAAPLFHMNAQFHIMLTLHCGGTAVLLERFDADVYLKAIETFSVARVTGVPTMFVLLLRAMARRAEVDTGNVRSIALGSAPVSEQLLDDLARAFPGAVITNGYGTTEAGPAIFGPHPQGAPTPPLSLGIPLPEVDVRLIGNEAGDRGELWVRNPMVATSGTHGPGGPEARDGWYATGDLMRRDDDGFFYFIGRHDDMMICGGENVYPAEVECRLEAHPEIAHAAVVAIPDEVKGDIPVAFVVAAAGSRLCAEEVRRFALDNGPAYAHPRFVAVVDELPLSTVNKTDRAALEREAVRRFGKLARDRNRQVHSTVPAVILPAGKGSCFTR